MSSGRSLTFARLGSQRVVVAAAAVIIVLATVLLTALWAYVGAAATAGVRAAITASSESDTGLSIRTTIADPADLPALDARVRAAVGDALADVPYSISERYETTDSYTLPTTGPGSSAGAPTRGEIADLTLFAWYADVEAHADLVAGSWPEGAGAVGEPVRVAVQRSAAEALGLSVGTAITVVQRLDERPVEVVVDGIYEPRDPAGWYWRADPLDTTGFVAGTQFATWGPLVVGDGETVVAAVQSSGTAPEWHVGPRWDETTPGSVEPTRQAVAAMLRQLPTERGTLAAGPISIDTGLAQLLTLVQRALVSNRSMMIVPLLQLALLAAYTLLLAARLLADHRTGESALLRARGLSRGQATALALREAAFLVLPAALVAPLLASGLLRLVDDRGPFGALSSSVDRPSPGWWLVSGAAAALCGLALVLPTLRPPATYVEAQSARGRTSRRGALQRAGADVLLLVLAVLAYLQLRHYESPVLSTGSAPQIDPLLVLGPCLALLAAAAVSVRLLTVVAGLAQRVAGRGSSLGPALGAWQVARRPLRYSGPALLLVLALAIGAMSTAYNATWRQSQRDQAVFAAGADVRLTAATGVRSGPPVGQSSQVAALDAVTAAAAAWRSAVALGDTTVDVLAIDASTGSSVVQLRDDLAGASGDDVLAPLAAGRHDVQGIPLDGEPTLLELSLTASSVALGPVEGGTTVQPGSISLVVRDAADSVIRLDPAPVVFDGTQQQVRADLRSVASDAGPVAVQPAYPLTIVGARLVIPTPIRYASLGSEEYVGYTSTLVVDELRADGVALTGDRPAWSGQSQSNTDFAVAPVDAPEDGVLSARVTSVPGVEETQVVAVTAGAASPTLPAVLDRTAAAAAGVGVGDSVSVALGGAPFKAEVVGIVDAFPGTDPAAGVVVVDYGTLTASRWLGSLAPTSPTEWWIASSDPAATVRAAVALPSLAADVISVDGLSAAYGDDPLGAMTLGALVAGFVAALAFAAVAFAVNLVIGARERLAEFSVLRALGVSRRQVLGTLLVEQAFLVGLGVAVGLAIGLVVSALVVPLVIISPRAARVFPPVLVDIPWLLLAATAAGTIALLGLLAGVAAARLQSGGLGALRLGEDS